MTKRTEFIRDLFYNGKNGTWNDYAIKYDFRDLKQANDYWRWFVANGSIEGCWEPGVKEFIIEEITSDTTEEIIKEEVLEVSNNYLTPKEELIESREFQEFLNWKMEKQSSRTFTPGTYAVIGCTHVPFHNKKFFQALLNLYSEINPTGLVIAGDFMEMSSVSGHEVGKKPLPGVSLGYEYEEGNKALDQLDNCNNWKIKHYLYGNHEDRFWRHIEKSDPSKYGSALINPTVALHLNERGYYTQDKWKEAVVYLGKHLEVVHGENCSQFATKKSMDLFRTSMVFFHTHRFQAYMEGNTAAWNLGWGGDINSECFNYATKAMKASWKNAAGIITIDELGGYHVQPIIWHNDRFYFNGKQYN
jgi:hypothetical protein